MNNDAVGHGPASLPFDSLLVDFDLRFEAQTIPRQLLDKSWADPAPVTAMDARAHTEGQTNFQGTQKVISGADNSHTIPKQFLHKSIAWVSHGAVGHGPTSLPFDSLLVDFDLRFEAQTSPRQFPNNS